MTDGNCSDLSSSNFKHPLLEKLNRMAAKLSGIGFTIVYPRNGGWGHAIPGGDLELSTFCGLIQGSKDGARHCKMCHILMAIAACGKDLTEQQCHAGASVLVSPICDGDDRGLAVLSSCTFAHGDGTTVPKEIRDRAEKLGIDHKELREAYLELPDLTDEKLEISLSIMAAAGDAVREIRDHHLAEVELGSLRGSRETMTNVETEVERELKKPMLAARMQDTDCPDEAESKGSALVRIISDLVSRKPSMPYSVAEIAAAARITPNHFSTLFHLHKGKSFTEYLTDCRMEAAKDLLRDLTLNIGEVALAVGYSDPGYFTRRFRFKTGMTPRDYRNAIGPV